MYRRHIVLLIAGLVGAVLFAVEPAPAPAQEPYPPTEPLLTVSAGTVVVGGDVTVEGCGYTPGEDVQITVSTTAQAARQLQDSGPAEPVAMLPVARAVSAQPPQVATAGGNGCFTATVTLNQVGTATIAATGVESGLSLSVVVTVVASGEGLPETGNAGLRWLPIGGAAVAIGSALLLGLQIWRRRPAKRPPAVPR